MSVKTNRLDLVEVELRDGSKHEVRRFEVFVNHKRQGVILGFPNGNAGKDFGIWMIEKNGKLDPFQTEYPDQRKAIDAVAALNGRKIKWKDDK
jgi:hypothetical protein